MARVGFWAERDSPQIGVGSGQKDGIFLSSGPFLRHLLSQLPRFRESGTARGGGPPSMMDNTHFSLC